MDNQLYQNIKRVRRLRGLTQESIAEMLHISSKAYSKIENGETRLDMDRLAEIAKALNLEVEELMRFDEKQVFNHCKQGGPYINSVIHQSFENERKLYEERVAELKEQVEYWKSRARQS